jgi:hypothetical protein
MNTRPRKPKIDAPETFEARGVCVPFAHRQLRHIRARAEPGTPPKQWEALFDDPSGEAGRRMIMPWTQLTGWIQFPPRDMALYFALSAQVEHGLDPLIVKTLVAEADRDLGADEIAKARHIVIEQETKLERFKAYVALLALAAREAGTVMEDAALKDADKAKIMAAIQGGPDGTKLTSAVFVHFAKRGGCDETEIAQRLEKFAELIGPLGVPDEDPTIFPGEGGLGRAATRLDEFRDQVRAHERRVRDQAAQNALLVAFAATQFRDLLRNEYAKLAAVTRDLGRSLASYEATLETLKSVRRRVAFALDGWEDCVKTWDEGVRLRDDGQSGTAPLDAIEYIVKIMPTMPRGEAEGVEEATCWNGIDLARSKMVRDLVNWIDGKEVSEMKQRIESKRA